MSSLCTSTCGDHTEKGQLALHEPVDSRRLVEPEGEPEDKPQEKQLPESEAAETCPPKAQIETCCSPDDKDKHATGTTYPQLDLVFMCDCTGSMGSYIQAAQQNIRSIVDRVVSSEKAEVRFALVAYRDHPPQDHTFITQIHPFTSDVNVMKGYVDTMSASGGGDGPEAVTAALHDSLNLPWRAFATKIAILIADAPPHGLEPMGDGFPNGDPLGRDPLDIARQMAKNEIVCYTVGCEPALGDYQFARDFMCTLAEITGGQAIALASAALLAEVIVQGSAEEISMTMLQREVEQELLNVRAVAEQQGEHLEDEVVYQRAAQHLQARNVMSKQMRNDGKMKNSSYSIWHKSGAQTLASAKAELCAAEGIRADDDYESEGSDMEVDCRSRTHAAMRSSRSGCGAPLAEKASLKKKKSRSAIGALASMFRGRARRSKSSAIMEVGVACLEEESRIDEEDEIAVLRSRCESPVACAKESFCAAAPAAMNKSVLAEDLISLDQVARIAKRAAHKSGR